MNKFLKTRQDERGINNPRLKDGPADIVELFKPFDTNQDGRLSYPDFKKGLKGLNLGLTSEECETFAQWVDQDGDCVIDTNELHERLQAHGDGEQNPTVPATPSDKADSSFRSPPPTLTSQKSLSFGKPPTPTNQSHATNRTPFESSIYVDDASDEDFPDDATLESYKPSTTADESFDYTQTPEKGRVSPVKLKKSEVEFPEYQTEAEYGASAIRALSPTADKDKIRLSPTSEGGPPMKVRTGGDDFPIFDPLDQSIPFDDRVGNQPNLSQKREARQNMQKSSDEYGIFSPIYKKESVNPFEPVKQEGEAQIRNRFASYVKNAHTLKTDHVASILKEDEIVEEMARTSDGAMSPYSRSQSKSTQRGTLDQVDALLTLGPGPQPEFTTNEYERKVHLKEMLQKRRDESVAELRKTHGLGSHECEVHKETYNRTFSSHLTGASGQVKQRPGHHAEHQRRRYSLVFPEGLNQEAEMEMFDSLTPAEFFAQKKVNKAGQTSQDQDHDHLRGTGAVVEVVAKPVASTEFTDSRCNDIAKTEKMILARLAGSGSVPALTRALKKADGSHSGVLNEEEFKRAMIRFGIELEPKQLENIMQETNLAANPVPPTSTAVLLNDYEDLNQRFMEYPKFLDNLDTRHKESHAAKSVNELDTSKIFSATGQAQLHPGKHQGRRVSKKILAKTAHLQRGKVEKVLSKYDSSKIGLVGPDELRRGLNDLGVSFSDKEFKTLREEVLGGGEKDRYALTDLIPSAAVFTAVCEADDFDAIQARNSILNSTTNFRSSAVLYPEMPQAKVLTGRERKERIASAKIASSIGTNDVLVKEAWDKSGKTATGENIQAVLGEAGVQVSKADAEVLARTVAHNHEQDTGSVPETLAFAELCKGIGVKSNIKVIRKDSRTGKAFLGTHKNMRSSQGVVREMEELPGGIFARVTHRAGSMDAAIRNGSDRVLDHMYHAQNFNRRMDEDAHHRMLRGNKKVHSGAAACGGEHFMAASNNFSDHILKGNKKRMASPDVRGKRGHLGTSSMEEVLNYAEKGDGRLSPELVGNKKGINDIAVESKIGSEDNTMIGRDYPRKDDSGRVSQSPFKSFATRMDETAHGNPVSKDHDSVSHTPNKRRGAPKSASWAASSMGDFIKLSGTTDDVSFGGMEGGGEEKKEEVGERETTMSTPTRTMRRAASASMAALPTFGVGTAPFATNTNLDATPLRPGGDASIVAQDYFQNSGEANARKNRRGAPFAVEGDKPVIYSSSKRFARSARLHGLGNAQGFNIINNLDV